MREILFRGKRVDNGKWVYGYYIKATHHWHNHGIHEDWIAVHTIQNGGWCNVMGKYAVLPETVGQFTGLTDRNGKKIFEGDIIDIHYENTIVRDAVVKYIGASFYGETVADTWELDNYHEIEVIGNIHDNKLVRGEEE